MDINGNVNMEGIPSHLEKCPIVETTINIGCTYKLPADAIIGVIYNLLLENHLKKIKLEKLPITNIPEAIREKDIDLKYKPTHKITCDVGVVLIGTHILSLGILPPYKSWKETSAFFSKILSLILKNPRIIDGISSVRLRYLNFFECNIFEKINVHINFQNKDITDVPTIFRTEKSSEDGLVNILQISNGVHIKNPALNLDAHGSLIDITILSQNVTIDTVFNKIEESHTKEKKLFFSILKKDFIEKLCKKIEV